MTTPSSPRPASNSALVHGYLQRVVNQRDLTAVDELVSSEYRGGGYGWPADVESLREFYRWQSSARPDWNIEVQQTIEVAECVVVHAYAGGAIAVDERGAPLVAPRVGAVEWLAMYRVENDLIVEIQVLALRDRQ